MQALFHLLFLQETELTPDRRTPSFLPSNVQGQKILKSTLFRLNYFRAVIAGPAGHVDCNATSVFKAD